MPAIGLELKVAEHSKELCRVNRMLKTMSECNQILVRAKDEGVLLNAICRIIVKEGRYCMAWIGFAEQDEAKTVRPVAQAGFGEGYLETIHVVYADSELGRGPTGRAIREARPCIARDIVNNPEFAPWREQALKRNYASSIALPLMKNGEALGALNIYSPETDVFDEMEVNFLAELANDLAFGIIAMRTRTALIRYQERLEDIVRERTSELERVNRELLKSKEAAEAADRLKSAFLATMSHELRTPLNSIIGFTGILLQGLAGPLNQEQIKQLGMVQNSSRHLLMLINDVLDISKIEAGQVEISSENFDLRKSLEKVVRMSESFAEKKGIGLNLNISNKVAEIVGDQRRTEQILLNLINNAIKFTEKGEVEVSCFIENNRIISSVRDTGIGINPEDMQRIFRPFHQIDTGLTRKYDGTGLGLAISKKLAEMMGGILEVASQPGIGSTFALILPKYRD